MTQERCADPLPLPRLVVRLGGLGNRHVGHDAGLSEASGPLWASAREAVGAVFDEVEKALLAILKDDDPARRQDVHGPPAPPWWKTRFLGAIFGQVDRWCWGRCVGAPFPVFDSKSAPTISLVSGDAIGADCLIREVATERRNTADHPVCYELLRVTNETPGRVEDGLGVGRPVPRSPSLATQAGSEAGSETGARATLPRSEAHAASAVARRRAYAYRAQSEALRHHSDLLLAIWDPDAEAKPGGTSESVEAALRDRIPVIAIRLTGKATAEIHVLEHLRHLRHLQGHGGECPREAWQAALGEVLRFLLGFPEPNPAGDGDHRHPAPPVAYSPRHAFAAFRADEPLRRLWPDRFWNCFDARARVDAIRDVLKDEQEATDRVKLESDRRDADSKLKTVDREMWTMVGPVPMPSGRVGKKGHPLSYADCYERARERASTSGMSGVYGNAHRGGIILSYVLAAFAVLFAVTGGLLHVWKISGWLQGVVAFAELAVIFLMWALHTSSKTDAWNVAYTDTRILAEALRLMETLAPLGVHTPLPRLPSAWSRSGDASHPDRLWSVWYFRALVRMAPLRLGAPDLKTARNDLEDQLLSAQRRYHRVNARKHQLLHHAIENLIPRLFGAVGFCAVLHFLDVTLGWHLPRLFEVSLVVCVGGPALISALHGFASQMEMKRLQIRSSNTERLLQERSAALAALDLSDPDSPEAVWGLAAEALAAASVLMEETTGWSGLYRDTSLPIG